MKNSLVFGDACSNWGRDVFIKNSSKKKSFNVTIVVLLNKVTQPNEIYFVAAGGKTKIKHCSSPSISDNYDFEILGETEGTV